MRYDAFLNRGEGCEADFASAYERTLAVRLWEKCGCQVCTELRMMWLSSAITTATSGRASTTRCGFIRKYAVYLEPKKKIRSLKDADP